MSMTKFQPPRLRNIIAGIVAFVALLLLLGGLSTVVKLLGVPFLYIPSKLGLTTLVAREDVQTLDLASSPTLLEIAKPGQYEVFAADYDLLVITDQLLAAGKEPWLSVKSQRTGKPVAVSFVKRGLRPYDTPFAKGRPIFTFAIKTPGKYVLTHITRKAIISVVPDYTTGKEKLLVLAYYLQIALIVVPLGIFYYRRYRVWQKRVQVLQAQKRIQSDAFWQAEIKRRGKDQ